MSEEHVRTRGIEDKGECVMGEERDISQEREVKVKKERKSPTNLKEHITLEIEFSTKKESQSGVQIENIRRREIETKSKREGGRRKENPLFLENPVNRMREL